MKSKIFGIILLIIGLLQSAGTAWLFPTCPPMENGSYMKCHWMGQSVIGVGLVLIVIAFIYIGVNQPLIRAGLSLSMIPIGLFTIAIAIVLIGVCGMAKMQCHAVTLPAVTILGGITVLLGVANTVYLLHSKG